MNTFAEILADAVAQIKNGAPQLKAIENVVNTVADIAAVAAPGAAPIVAAIEAGEAALNKVVESAQPLAESFAPVLDTILPPATAPIASLIPARVTATLQEVSTVADIVAATGGCTVAAVAQDVSKIVASVEQVNTIAATPVPEAAPAVDHATLAAGNVASSEAAPSDITARLMALENFAVTVAPLLGTVAKQLGL